MTPIAAAATPSIRIIGGGCYGYVDGNLPPSEGGRLDFIARCANGRPANGHIEIHPGFKRWEINGWERQPHVPTSLAGNAAVIIGASPIMNPDRRGNGGLRGFATRDEAVEFLRDEAVEFLRGELEVQDCVSGEPRPIGKLLDLKITNPCPGPDACPHATPRGQRKAFRKCVWAPVDSLD